MPPTPPHPPVQDTREVEWQLATDDLAPVRLWLGAHRTLDGLRVEPLPPQELRDTYLDTVDWRVFRSGFALRVRQTDSHAEATLKGLRSARADVADRQEITQALPGSRIELLRAPGPVGAWLREALDDRPLRALFTAHTHRERFALHRGAQGRPVGELALDETRLLGPSQEVLERLLRVEVEVRDGPPEPLAPWVEALSQSCHLERAPENKFAAGLRAAALAPPLD